MAYSSWPMTPEGHRVINPNATLKTSPGIVIDVLDARTGQVLRDLWPSVFTLRENESEHQVATIEGWYVVPWIRKKGSSSAWIKPPAKLLAKGRKLVITFGRKPGLKNFPCEVYSAKVTSTATLPNIRNAHIVKVTYTFVGASWSMQTKAKTRSWGTGASYSYLARTLARENGMLAVVDEHPRVFPYVTQQGETDFAFLRRIAKEIGYTFFVDGTTLYFRDPRKTLGQAAAAVPTMVMDKRPGRWDTLLEFKSTDDVDPGPTAVRRVYAYNPNTNSVIEARNQYLDSTAFDMEDPREYRGETTTMQLSADRALTSYAEAADYARWDALVHHRWIKATIKGQGDVRVRPGSLVNLEGDAFLDDSAGFWAVTKMTHTIYNRSGAPRVNQYYVEGEIARDKVYDRNFVPTTVWTDAKANALLVNGKWRAEMLSLPNEDIY